MKEYLQEIKDVIQSQTNFRGAFLVGAIWAGLTMVGIASLFLAIIKRKNTKECFSFIGVNPNCGILK